MNNREKPPIEKNASESKKDFSWNDFLTRVKNLPESSLEKNTGAISSLAYDAYNKDRFWGSGKKRILLEGGSSSLSEESNSSQNNAPK